MLDRAFSLLHRDTWLLPQILGPGVLPFNSEKQNLLMHVLHDLHQGLGWGDQYFRFGRIHENAGKKAAKIQIINNRVSVAAGLHEVGIDLRYVHDSICTLAI